MKSTLLYGALGALATGVAIGVQSTISSRVGGMIGNLRTGLLMNLLGGTIAGVIVLGLLWRQGGTYFRMPVPAFLLLLVAGALGIVIITGIAFSFQRTGVAAGIASLILGQLFISLIVDTTGIGGVAPIEFSLKRALGLVVMLGAVYLLLPGD